MEKTTSSVIWNSKSFHWSIRNFSDICGLRTDGSDDEDNEAELAHSSQEYGCILDIDFLQSPIIDVGNVNEGSLSHWLVRLMKSTEEENSIDMHIELVQNGSESENEEASGPSECFFKYRIDIIGSNGQSFQKKDSNKIVYLKSGKSWCEPSLIQMDRLKYHVDQVLQDDVLNLQIDIFVLNDLHHSRLDGLDGDGSIPVKKRRHASHPDWQEVLSSCQLKLAKHVLNNLWMTRLNGDVTIECADSQFLVHKNILSSSSPVFSAAFTHDMCENSENKIVITDMKPAIVETMLRFIYCDANLDESHWRNVDDLADLLNAAEKYQIMTLKTLCFSKLCGELTLNNAAQITALVYLFGPEESVKHFIHQYVIRNINVLKEMDSFKKKMNEIPAAFTPLLLLFGESS